ncbi:hypothetical protein [uncultured Polaribacter sp.]|uniref:hypothetical protein n=1 Tax=uncultured Polaribacter sp. TaxID=174711 RepID=UPI00259B55FD|nr:hypothetical protein [uncultured Polaribacter sp.]
MQIIELYIRGYKRYNGSGVSLVANQLIDESGNFSSTIEVGDFVTNLSSGEIAKVTAVVSDTELTLSTSLFTPLSLSEPYRITSDYFRADLFEDESITITDSLLNVKDIGKVFTPFSQQFNLPASKLNNKLFRHYENLSIENSFDARYRHDAIIKLNGIDYKKGKIQFKSVSLKDNKAHAYKVVFYGDAVELKEVLGETTLAGLNYPDSLNFDYTQLNIENLFTAGDSAIETSFGSTNILVPNIHHSKNMRYSNSGYQDNATGTGLIWTDLKPAIRCKTIIDAISNTFPQIKLKGFFNSTSFKDVFMWMHRNEGYITNAEEGGDTFILRNRFRHQDDDPIGFNFSSITSSYGYTDDPRSIVIEQPGWQNQYVARVDITTGTTESYTVRILKGSTGYVYSEQNYQNQTSTSTTAVIDYNLTPSQFLDLIIEVEAENTISLTQSLVIRRKFRPYPSDNAWYDLYAATYTPASSTVDKTFDVAKQMPKMKVMDFLSGLFKMFNLVVFKDGDEINVQRASFFMNIGTSYDITKYVDMSSSSIERLFQYKEMDFKFKSKKSFLVQFSDEIQGVPFSEESYGDNEWDGGIYKIEIPFEKMMYERLSNEDTGAQTLIGQGAFLDKKFEPTIGEPLLFCMEYQANTNNELTIGGVAPGNYRRPTQLTSFDWGFDTKLQLNFGLEADEWLGEIPSQSTNLFEDGYLDYVETVFNRKSRMLKVSAYLPLSIITKYNLNDKFIINNQSFRINSIKTNLLTNKTDLELYNKDEFVSQLQNDQVAYLGRVAQLTESAKGTDFITVSWDAVTGATGYNVYVNGGLFSAEPNTTTTLKVNGLESGFTYDISVRVKYSISGNDIFSFDTGITATTT